MCRLQNNLCLYCEKAEHFKYECMKATKIMISKKHDCESSAYQETSSYKEAYQETSHEKI